jgi:hypothetical protein
VNLRTLHITIDAKEEGGAFGELLDLLDDAELRYSAITTPANAYERDEYRKRMEELDDQG